MYQVQPAKEAAHKKGKPFCKVCFDAGKQEREYTSHCVKTDGVVTCTTLLSQSCRNCGQHGHTRGYCKTIVLAETELRFKSKSKWEPTNTNVCEPTNVYEPTHYNPKSNAFGILSQKQPPKQSNEKSQTKPMTMAERLKNPTSKPNPTPEVKPVYKSIQIKIDMPPKSQFWWQDEVE